MKRVSKQTITLAERLAREAARMKAEAETIPRGRARDALLRRAMEIETTAGIDKWLSTPGLRATA